MKIYEIESCNLCYNDTTVSCKMEEFIFIKLMFFFLEIIFFIVANSFSSKSSLTSLILSRKGTQIHIYMLAYLVSLFHKDSPKNCLKSYPNVLTFIYFSSLIGITLS